MNRIKISTLSAWLIVVGCVVTPPSFAQENSVAPPVAETNATGVSANEDEESADEEVSPDVETDLREGESDAAASGGGWIRDFFNTPPLSYMFTGGIFMWPILLMGIIGAGVVIERFRSLKMLETDSSEIRQNVQNMLDQNEVQQAFHYCNEQQGPVPAILATGLRKYLVLETLGYDPARVEEQVVKSMDDYSVHVVAALERHLPVLATIASVAPMLGFLGTVQGMIVAFQDIVDTMGEVNIVLAAAAGLKVSLMTTCFGLIIGIPAFIAFNYFTSLINRFVLDVEESATDLIEAVTLRTAIEAATEPVGGTVIGRVAGD